MKNVLGKDLQACCTDPMTGFFRDGYCRMAGEDMGLHLVCVRVTAEFLEFSRSVGNDLSTPVPEYDFDGLVPGDQWCLCVERWKQALEADVAPPVKLEATHISALEYVSLQELKNYAIDSAK